MSTLSTKVTDNELAAGIKDEFGVVYSVDGKRLLKCENDKIGQYKIKDGTKVICDWAFEWCEALQQIVIPNSITSIGKSAFYCCKSLQQIIIPHYVTHIDSNPFAYCKRINVKSESKQFVVQDKMLIDTIERRLITYFGHKQSVLIPNIVTLIGDSAFLNCNSLRKVVFSDSLTNIEEYAFRDCESLQQVSFSNSLISIGESAFSHCISLQQVVIPNSVTKISDAAFNLCGSLQQIIISDSVMSIGNLAFSYCCSLQQITIPDSVTRIGETAFISCDSLQHIIIPEGSAEKFIKMLPANLLDKVYCIKKAYSDEQIAEKRKDLPF